MFLKFKVANFLSINEAVEINFQIPPKQKLDDTSVQIKDGYVNKLACVVGPNAAGKTNILRSFACFALFIRDSYLGNPLAVIPHFFSEDKNSFFETEFIIKDKKYRYGIELNENEIFYESLSLYNEKTHRPSSVFKRKKNECSINKKIKINKIDKGRLTSKTALFSLLMNLNYFKGTDYDGLVFPTVIHNAKMPNEISIFPPEILRLESFADELEKNPDKLNALNNEIQKVDFGITKISIGKFVPSVTGAENNNLFSEKERNVLLAIHKYKDKQEAVPFIFESNGTRSYAKLYTKIKEILDFGGILIADELEASLHIDLVERILNLFMRKETNPNNAQILFTTHNPWFLQYLTKSQIFIAQKQDNLSTECFRLDEVNGVRNDENFFMKYISGEYDGKPRIKED